MRERRTAKRVRANLGVRWEGLFTEGRGSIGDIGPWGCFVLTGGEVQPGDLISLEIRLPNEEVTVQWGEVVYVYGEIGFALHFTFSTSEEERALARLVESLDRRE